MKTAVVNEYFGYFPVLLEFLGISEREVQHILNLYRSHGKQNCSIDFLLDDAVFGHADIWLRTTIAPQKAFDPTSCLIHQVGIWSHGFSNFSPYLCALLTQRASRNGCRISRCHLSQSYTGAPMTQNHVILKNDCFTVSHEVPEFKG